MEIFGEFPIASEDQPPRQCWGLSRSIQKDAKNLKIPETLSNGYSFESTQRELSNEYQHDRIEMVFKNLCVLVLWNSSGNCHLDL